MQTLIKNNNISFILSVSCCFGCVHYRCQYKIVTNTYLTVLTGHVADLFVKNDYPNSALFVFVNSWRVGGALFVPLMILL